MSVYLSAEFLEDIRHDWLSMHRAKDRSSLIARKAADAGVSRGTLYRKLDLAKLSGRKKRSVSMDDKNKAKREELDRYGKLVFEFALENTHDLSKCDWNLALEFLQSEGRIPSDVTEQQIYKAIARQELKREHSPVALRFEREHAMSLLQCDFSVSRHIKHVGSGRLQVREPGATKMTPDRRRLWFGLAIDDATRVAYVEYFIAPGESAVEAQKFLARVFARKPSARHIPHDFLLQGIPEAIYVDRGSGWMDGSTQIGLARMGIQCIIGANERDQLGRVMKRSNKKARGKVERLVKSVKEEFEMMYSLRHPAGSETSLAELNHDLWEWLECHNQEAHPTRTVKDGSELGKWNLYKECLGRILHPEENMLSLFTKRIMKKVRAGLVNVAVNTYCIAPTWAHEGSEIEIVENHGFYYTMKDGERIPLEFQNAIARTPQHETLALAIESNEDRLDGSAINERFDQELQKLSGGKIAIRSLSDVLWATIEEFFTVSRTVLEIKEKAREVYEQLVPPLPTISINEKGEIIYEGH